MSGATTKARGGFTLIELMVVIAIIGLLASLILASLNSAKTKGVNARIQSDIHQYQNALELYYTKNGAYPTPTAGNNTWVCLGKGYTVQAGYCWKNNNTNDADDPGLDTALTQFIPGPPPGQSITVGSFIYDGYIYKVTGNGTGYEIRWILNGTNLACSYLNGHQGGAYNGNTDNANVATTCDLLVP